jgi:arabinose-5-phosphate isomerase
MSEPPRKPHDHPLPSRYVRVEAQALLELALKLEGPMLPQFTEAADLVLKGIARRNRVIVTGIGKSGIIARKIAATLRSTGTPAHYLHPAEAVHGDLGMLAHNDTVIVLSASGETEELLRLLPLLKRMADKLITFCGNPGSTLAKASDVVLDTSVTSEACPNNLAPTASTTVMLALGDALALDVSSRRGWKPEDFAQLHPGGRLGKRLAKVGDLMHMDDVDGDGGLLGMISDGDLRRLLERDGGKALKHAAGEIMNAHPVTVDPQAFASSALALMEEKKITSLIVTSKGGRAEGVLHLHDLWTLELI